MDAFNSISPIKDFYRQPRSWSSATTASASRSTRSRNAAKRDMTYSAPLRVRVRLHYRGVGRESRASPIKKFSCMGDFPLMTDKGTFMINGAGARDREPTRPLARRVLLAGRRCSTTGRRSTPRSSPTAVPGSSSRNRQRYEERRDRGHDRQARIDKNRKIYATTFIRARSRAPTWAATGSQRRGDPRALRRLMPLIANCLEKDKHIKTKEDALKEIYKKLRP